MSNNGSQPTVVTGGASTVGAHVRKRLRPGWYSPAVCHNLVEGLERPLKCRPLEIDDTHDGARFDDLIACNRSRAITQFVVSALIVHSIADLRKYGRDNIFGYLSLLEEMCDCVIEGPILSSNAITCGRPEEVLISEDTAPIIVVSDPARAEHELGLTGASRDPAVTIVSAV